MKSSSEKFDLSKVDPDFLDQSLKFFKSKEYRRYTETRKIDIVLKWLRGQFAKLLGR